MINSVVKVIRGITKIRGNSDGTLIGNVSDRLKVTSAGDVNTTTPKIHRMGNLLNAGNDDMSVDGSVTPVEFTFSPGASETWYLRQLNVILGANGDTDHDEFGNQTALTNGVKVEVKSDGTTYNLWNGNSTTIKRNIELTSMFNQDATPGITSSKWFNNAGGRYYIGNKRFDEHEWILKNSTSDFIKVTIQDDLTTSVLFMTVGYHIWSV